MKAEAERIILGSGYIHIGTFTKGMIIPNPEEFCTDDTRYAYISGGATLEYSPEFYEAKDDMGQVAKTIMTEEEATLTAGIMTFTGNSLEKLCDTARVNTRQSVDGNTTYRVVKIGGAGNQKGAKYVICFHHIDAVDGDIYVMIVGQNQAGFSLSFKKDEATVVDAEFHALPMDDEGTLITYTEVEPNTTTSYAVTQDLTNVTSSFTGSSVAANAAFEATLTADSGYTIDTPTVTMGGVTVTDAWDSSTGKVSIAAVTGAVVITATATAD